ncbi:MAG: B12-binding domain-containing radical SAM protein [Deltaproteobacteria bacterium]|nr:B12-binding domain-containing radical SAM protein [Deltaproteobacteria bacterium]
MAKAWRADVPVFAGGIHATLATEDVLSVPEIDGACRGEGELAFLELLNKLDHNAPIEDTAGFWFKRDGEILRNRRRPFIRDLDSLPYMDRAAIDYQRTIDVNNDLVTTMVGRGCAYECTFCANAQLKAAGTGMYVRNRSVDNALGDLEEMAGRFHFQYINFRDDNFSWNRPWVMEFCEKYPQKYSWPFDCFSRSDTLDDDQMRALKEAGCRHVFLGLDAGNDRIRRDVLNKHTSAREMIDVCDKLNRLGIKAVVSNIVGLPHETPKDFEDTIEVNRRIHEKQVVFSPAFGAAPKIWVFVPFPGTPLHEMCAKEGWLREVPGDFRIYRETHIEMPQFTPKQIMRAYRNFRFNVYKRRHPFWACIFRLYDTAAVTWVMERIPDYWFGQVRRFFAAISHRLRPAPTPAVH